MKFTKLNPYESILADLDTWLNTHYSAIETLMLRTSPTGGKIRELTFSKAIKDGNNAIIGIISVNILNDKYAALNLRTDTLNKRDPGDDTPGRVFNSESFKEGFFDGRDRLNLRLSFKQYLSDAMGLANVTMSAVYRFLPAESNKIVRGLNSREVTSYMWEDHAVVTTTREYFNTYVKPTLNAWTPAVADITVQTLYEPTT